MRRVDSQTPHGLPHIRPKMGITVESHRRVRAAGKPSGEPLRKGETQSPTGCDSQEFDTEWGINFYRSFSISPHRLSRGTPTLFCIVSEKAPGSCGHFSPDPSEQARPGSGPYLESLDIVGPVKACPRVLRTITD